MIRLSRRRRLRQRLLCMCFCFCGLIKSNQAKVLYKSVSISFCPSDLLLPFHFLMNYFNPKYTFKSYYGARLKCKNEAWHTTKMKFHSFCHQRQEKHTIFSGVSVCFLIRGVDFSLYDANNRADECFELPFIIRVAKGRIIRGRKMFRAKWWWKITMEGGQRSGKWFASFGVNCHF